ncbi:Tryptophan synthase alpha chain [hydrothermal vent metagenome]|uniref:tryptophan synthase n=1 Tax=hydrothermal vent metagenome TaxID=652676 RepID=A0A1W1CVT4_9ZZZZ
MSRLKNTFTNLKQINKKAFIPFITAGDSGLDNSLKLMFTLVENGADIIELGVPFSDPMADGIVIQKSHERAVAQGVSLKMVLDLVKKFRQTNTKTPVVLMGYLNPIEKMGYQNFAKSAKENGVDGVLIVDMPPEEATELHQELQNNNIDLIFLIAPTTSDKRLKKISDIASGFVYFVSLKGVTGASNIDVDLVKSQLNHIKTFVNLPVGVGFGINDSKTAKQLSTVSDGIIVGSAIVKLIEKNQSQHDKMHQEVSQLVKSITTNI